MTNRYLSKIAKIDIDATGTGLDNTPKAPRITLKEPVKPLPTLAKEAGAKLDGVKAWAKSLNGTDKVKIGMSATGLGLGTVGYIEGHAKMKGDRHRENLEAQSLTTLRKIHESLTAKDKPV